MRGISLNSVPSVLSRLHFLLESYISPRKRLEIAVEFLEIEAEFQVSPFVEMKVWWIVDYHRTSLTTEAAAPTDWADTSI